MDAGIMVITTGGETDLFDAVGRIMDEFHGLEHQGGRRECSIDESREGPGITFLDIEMYIQAVGVESGFGVGMEWLRLGLRNAGLPDAWWDLRHARIEVEDDDLPGTRVVRPASEPDRP
ncbi:hypothetical protein FAIPA1_580002 [Frankia sp. AiPs1]|uniref:hypothetical protein n=1 Tax=Frankia sp. AiPa1 TaxID=573492 RepID=UPI00202B6936|nr:hypothetical protein [Frankia sp. AiPa1]MCL9759247.1 hypothetical protein [Frankia sp. AiPa1]